MIGIKNVHTRSQSLVPKRNHLDEIIPIAKAQELIVDVPVNPRDFGYVYIDRLMSLTVNEEDYLEWIEASSLLVIEAAASPRQAHEPLPREDMEVQNELEAKSAVEEIKTILGWIFDFHFFLILLPENKYLAWLRDIRNMLQ